MKHRKCDHHKMSNAPLVCNQDTPDNIFLYLHAIIKKEFFWTASLHKAPGQVYIGYPYEAYTGAVAFRIDGWQRPDTNVIY